MRHFGGPNVSRWGMPEPSIELPFPSATRPRNDVKIAPARRANTVRRRRAEPLPGSRLFGPQTPVRLCVTPHIGSELWLRIEASTGEFWVLADCSLLELVKTIQQGGHWVWYKP